MAQDYFPLSKNEAIRRGFSWHDREERDYKVTLNSEDLPRRFADIKEDIVNQVIKCASQISEEERNKYPQCATAFNITELELGLYKILQIPLPLKCYPCRRQGRYKFRNPRRLWHRQCMCDKKNHFHGEGKCVVEFETSYAPERPEIVYCEKCYQQEVY